MYDFCDLCVCRHSHPGIHILLTSPPAALEASSICRGNLGAEALTTHIYNMTQINTSPHPDKKVTIIAKIVSLGIDWKIKYSMFF